VIIITILHKVIQEHLKKPSMKMGTSTNTLEGAT